MASGESGFTIDGTTYESPTVNSFDMDEAQILWDYTGFAVEDFAPDLDDGQFSDDRIEELRAMMKNPAFRRTLLHVAYRRGNRGASRKAIEEAIGKVSNVDSLVEWAQQFEEDDASPPESTNEPERSSPESSGDSSESSGLRSLPTSDAQAASPEPTGASTSGTSSPESARRTSAA